MTPKMSIIIPARSSETPAALNPILCTSRVEKYSYWLTTTVPSCNSNSTWYWPENSSNPPNTPVKLLVLAADVLCDDYLTTNLHRVELHGLPEYTIKPERIHTFFGKGFARFLQVWQKAKIRSEWRETRHYLRLKTL